MVRLLRRGVCREAPVRSGYTTRDGRNPASQSQTALHGRLKSTRLSRPRLSRTPVYRIGPARGMISAGTVEGMNNQLKVITRRAYGFRTYRTIEVALYHTLGKLPDPQDLPPTDSADEPKKEERLAPPR